MIKSYTYFDLIIKIFISYLIILIQFIHPAQSKGDPRTLKILVVRINSNSSIFLSSAKSINGAKPLDELAIVGAEKNSIIITDGKGKEYFNIVKATNLARFTVGGSLGVHTITIKDKKGKIKDQLTFKVDANTNISNGGRYTELFDLLYKSMKVDQPKGIDSVVWQGKAYHYFVPWVLDNYQTLKGMQYFSPYGSDLVDLFRKTQRADGLIWSNVQKDAGFPNYFDSEYEKLGYSKRDGKVLFVRQPVENMVEYLYVNTIYQCWKGNGDDLWMNENLNSAARALDYNYKDSSRWSQKYKLLKRAYTIDSWDFQIDDSTTPDIGINSTMVIDPHLTKFGIFYGDNTGYAIACEELAEMYDHNEKKIEAEIYRTRAKEVRHNLNALAWNGKFFTHRIEEDENIKRDLGVDEKAQISQSNAYSINRGLTHEQNVAIIKTYLNLKSNLPEGSPGEWYAIYPPFEKGFEKHNKKWQYMNGGVAGHAIGELARGAYENGYEAYGTDILDRFLALIKKYNNKVYFAYTGAMPVSKPVQNFTTIDLAKYANMSLSDKTENGVTDWMDENTNGNDMTALPSGMQTFNHIKFYIVNPKANNNRVAVAVSSKKGLRPSVEVPINKKAGTVYLLHAASKVGSENICGTIEILYEDGNKFFQSIIKGKHLSSWWFPQLYKDDAGIAWRGANQLCKTIGLSWAAIDNPSPEKLIKSIIIKSTVDEAIYSVVALSLGDKPHYAKPNPISFGGPDNWAAGTGMAALVEGLAGVKDEKTKYREVQLSPRWITTDVKNIDVTIRYAASDGYVAYHYETDPSKNQIKITATGSGNKIDFHILLPQGVNQIKSVSDGKKNIIPFKISSMENSNYADFTISELSPQEVAVIY